MSVEVFKAIRQVAATGNFVVSSRSNKDTPAIYHEWEMAYYSKTFPFLNNTQRKAAWIITSLYTGDIFQPREYKRAQALCEEYDKDYVARSGRHTYEVVSAGEPAENVIAVTEGFLAYAFARRPKKICATIELSLDGAIMFVGKMSTNSKKLYLTSDKHRAMVVDTDERLEKLLNRIPAMYQAQARHIDTIKN